MVCKTVGELKKALEKFSDDTPLDLMARIYGEDHGTYYTRRDTFCLEKNEGMDIDVYEHNGFCRIENDEAKHLELE